MRRLDLCKENYPILADISFYRPDQFKQMIEETNPNTVIVTSRDDTHIDYILQGLEHDLHVVTVTGKPMVTNAADARKVIEAEEKSDGKVTVTFNYRYNAFHRKIKELILEDKIGRVTSVDLNLLTIGDFTGEIGDPKGKLVDKKTI